MSDQKTESAMPLKGIKVIELGSLIAGPYASTLLGQFGAEIVKIEPPEGETHCVNGVSSMTKRHCGGIPKAVIRSQSR